MPEMRPFGKKEKAPSLPVTAVVATVEHCRALVSASKLLRIVSHFFTATIWTCLPNHSIFLDVILGQSLYGREL